MTGAEPFSNAGVKSTSFGTIPLLSKVIIPLSMSSSVIGGGSSRFSAIGAKRFLFTVFVCLAAYDFVTEVSVRFKIPADLSLGISS